MQEIKNSQGIKNSQINNQSGTFRELRKLPDETVACTLSPIIDTIFSVPRI